MLVKLGRKRKVILDQDFRVNYGTINDTDAKSVYVELKSWIAPIDEKDSYELDVRKLDKFIRQELYSILPTDTFHSRYIVDCNLRYSGMSVGKRSFMNIELVLYPKDSQTPFSKNKPLQTLLQTLSKSIITRVKTRGGYTFSRTKV